jgi:hypothetical protein
MWTNDVDRTDTVHMFIEQHVITFRMNMNCIALNKSYTIGNDRMIDNIAYG